MVVILETRVEKRKKLKRKKRISYLKFLIILWTCVILFLGIKLVNDYIIYLGYMDNPTIFSLNIRQRRLELFGERYVIDLRILKKID
jgi:hypothetical protein